MRKVFLFLLAATMLTSCDYFKSSSKDDSDTEEETPKKKKKKPLADEEEEEESPKKKKKPVNDDAEEEVVNEDEESNGGWTKAERTTFLETCVENAKVNVTESRAKTYCSCMQKKIESKYDSYDDANNKLSSTELNRLAAQCNQE
jgi:hypothetical protein